MKQFEIKFHCTGANEKALNDCLQFIMKNLEPAGETIARGTFTNGSQETRGSKATLKKLAEQKAFQNKMKSKGSK